MRVYLALAAVLVVAGTLAPAVVAHHSRSAEFDVDVAVSFTGNVVRVDWRNPHVWIFIDATDADGTVTHWESQLGGNPVSMARNGWRMDTLAPGEEVAVEGIMSYCCENVMLADTIQRANGERVFAGRAPGE